MNKLIYSQYLHNFCEHQPTISQYHKFSVDYEINVFTKLSLYIFSIAVLETLKFEWQYSQYLELDRTCGCAQFHFQSQKDMVKKITIFSNSF